MISINSYDEALNLMTLPYITAIEEASRKSRGKRAVIPENVMLNFAAERRELTRAINQAHARYKIKNLDPCVDERFVKKAFLYDGRCLWFKRAGTIFAQRANPVGGWTMNELYRQAYIKIIGGDVETLTKESPIALFVPGMDNSELVEKTPAGLLDAKDETGVLIYENQAREPFIYTAISRAAMIANAERTIEVASNRMKAPFIIGCDEELASDALDIVRAYTDNQLYHIMSTRGFTKDAYDFISIDNGVESVNAAKALAEWERQMYNHECNMNANTQADKKGENLTEDEIHQNDGNAEQLEESIIDYMNEQFKFKKEVLGGEATYVDIAHPKTQMVVENKSDKEEEDYGNDDAE